MITISGLDKLQRQLDEASKAFSALDGEVATLSFDPDDDASVAAAISTMEKVIDAKAKPYRSNPMVMGIVAALKAKYASQLRGRTALAVPGE